MSILSFTQALCRPSIPVLCYHQVRPGSGMSPEKFGTHLDIIRKIGFDTISLLDLYEIIREKKSITSPSIVLTFDDCTLDNWIYAIPELQKRNMKGVFFAITDDIMDGSARKRSDQTASPLEIPPTPHIMSRALQGDKFFFMNRSEIFATVHELNMEVYSHTATHQACYLNMTPTGQLSDQAHWSHHALSGYDAPPSTPTFPIGSAYAHNGWGKSWTGEKLQINSPDLRKKFCIKDFSQSKKTLEEILDKPCPFLCLPWGQGDNITLEAAQEAGFLGVLNLRYNAVCGKTDPFSIGRLSVSNRRKKIWLLTKLLLLAHSTSARIINRLRWKRP